MPGGLLAVHAHPDDETLSTGALLATWAAARRPVTVVTCTRGEQGEVIGAALAALEGDGAALAVHREGELAGALAALGVVDHVFLDHAGPDPAVRYVDSGMAWVGVSQAAAGEVPPDGAFVGVDLDEAAGRLAALIRDRRPDVVVGYEPGGGYGHPDHVRAHEVMHRAATLAAEADGGAQGHLVPVLLWSVVEEARLRNGYRAVAGRAVDGLEAPDPDGPVPSCAVTRADLAVDVLPVLPAVLGALRAHATQVQAVRPGPGEQDVLASYALSDAVVKPLLGTESYRFAPHGTHAPVVWPTGLTPVA
jgi:N-acetyl-1-D-myo-inositol-2-amino-2-deoxy-alpha-D-glucopyranoside deacetylase